MKRILLLFLFVTALVAIGETASANRVSVDVPLANIRSGPGTNYDILWKVEKNHPLEVIKKQGKWIHFRDYEGDRGWIFADLVSQKKAVIVRKTNCNVRSGPGTDKPIQFTVEKGVPFLELDRKGNWIRIQHEDGDKGWIYKSLIW